MLILPYYCPSLQVINSIVVYYIGAILIHVCMYYCARNILIDLFYCSLYVCHTYIYIYIYSGHFMN